MANAVYPSALSGLLTGAIDLDTATVKVALVRDYTYDSADTTVADVVASGATLHATSAALTSITTTAGAFDAADVVFTSVTADEGDHSLLVFQSSAVGGGADVAQASQLVIAYIDTGSSGLPLVPNGGNVSIVWDTSIFSI